MRSESTSAFGQPSETKPTFGILETVRRVSGRAAARLLLFRIGFVLLAGRKAGEREAGEHVARLVLHLVLELREHLLALLHVGLHQALHGGTLEVHELAPEFLRGARVVAV